MYNRILVPLDGSELAECSLEHVKEVAVGCHVPEVVLLAVVEPANDSMPWSWGGIAAAQTQMEAERDSKTTSVADFRGMTAEQKQAKIDKMMQDSANDYICQVADKLSKEGLNVRTCVLSGKPAETILDYASSNGVDLIVMATHGRGGQSRWDFGKVADRIIRTSSVPVLMASPAGCRV